VTDRNNKMELGKTHSLHSSKTSIKCLPDNTVQHTRRLESSTLLWETQISHCLKHRILLSDNSGECPGSI